MNAITVRIITMIYQVRPCGEVHGAIKVRRCRVVSGVDLEPEDHNDSEERLPVRLRPT